jgi:hypothetical protein
MNPSPKRDLLLVCSLLLVAVTFTLLAVVTLLPE